MTSNYIVPLHKSLTVIDEYIDSESLSDIPLEIKFQCYGLCIDCKSVKDSIRILDEVDNRKKDEKNAILKFKMDLQQRNKILIEAVNRLELSILEAQRRNKQTKEKENYSSFIEDIYSSAINFNPDIFTRSPKQNTKVIRSRQGREIKKLFYRIILLCHTDKIVLKNKNIKDNLTSFFVSAKQVYKQFKIDGNWEVANKSLYNIYYDVCMFRLDNGIKTRLPKILLNIAKSRVQDKINEYLEFTSSSDFRYLQKYRKDPQSVYEEYTSILTNKISELTKMLMVIDKQNKI